MCRCCCWCCCSRTHFLRCIFFCTENIYLLCRRHRCRQAGKHRAAYTEYTYRLYHINFDWINVCLWWTNIKQKKKTKNGKNIKNRQNVTVSGGQCEWLHLIASGNCHFHPCILHNAAHPPFVVLFMWILWFFYYIFAWIRNIETETEANRRKFTRLDHQTGSSILLRLCGMRIFYSHLMYWMNSRSRRLPIIQ